jgi:hypothetical protein
MSGVYRRNFIISKTCTASLLSRTLLLLQLCWTAFERCYSRYQKCAKVGLEIKARSIKPALEGVANFVHHENTVPSVQVIVHPIIRDDSQPIHIKIEMLNEDTNDSQNRRIGSLRAYVISNSQASRTNINSGESLRSMPETYIFS